MHEMVGATMELVEPGQAWRRGSDGVVGWTSDEGPSLPAGTVRWIPEGLGVDDLGQVLSRSELVSKFRRDLSLEAFEEAVSRGEIDPWDDESGLDNMPDFRAGGVVGFDDLPDGYADPELDGGAVEDDRRTYDAVARPSGSRSSEQ